MRDTIFSGIGSLLSVMTSHVRRCSKLGADAPPHFSRISIFFDHRRQPAAAERTGQKITLHGEFPHLGAQIPDMALGVLEDRIPVVEYFAQVLQRLLAPRGDLGGVDAVA